MPSSKDTDPLLTRGYGSDAQRFVARLPRDLAVIAAGLDGAVLGLAAALDERRFGRPFFTAPLVDDPRATRALAISGELFRRYTDLDSRRLAFDALANEDYGPNSSRVELKEFALPTGGTIDEAARRVLRDFAIVGDAVLVRSVREAERVQWVLGRYRPWIAAPTANDPAIPQITPRRGETIVVWAPQLDAERLGVIAMGLDYLNSPVVYVCSGGSLSGARGAFVEPERAVEALREAACVIDASIGDPSSACTLATLGVPLIATTTSGAAESLDGVFEYDPWNWRTVLAAASAARGAAPPAVKEAQRPRAALDASLARAHDAMAVDGPLVTIVMPTFNRRELLAVALESLERQVYRNLEIIVVNDAGERVEDVVARHPRARLVNMPQNGGPYTAFVAGLQTMRGKYFGMLCDDDVMFPDHVARLVYALESSGASIAHTNCATRYFSRDNGVERTLAHRIWYDRPLDRVHMFTGGTMAFGCCLFRSTLREEIGDVDASLGLADTEYLLRASQTHDFIHVDRVTYLWNYSADLGSFTHANNELLDHLRRIYDRYPSGGSSTIEAMRAKEIGRFSNRGEGVLWPPDLPLPS